MAFSSLTRARCLADAALPPGYTDAWDADLGSLPREQQHAAVVRLFEAAGAFAAKLTTPGRLRRFLAALEPLYHASNPYHCWAHALDVTQAAACMLRAAAAGGGGDRPSPSPHHAHAYAHPPASPPLRIAPLDGFCLLVAALAHDAGHPGVSNALLVATRDPLCLRHGDSAPAEAAHCAALYGLCAAQPEADIFGLLDDAAWRAARRSVLAMIAATDLAQHTGLVARAELWVQLRCEAEAAAERAAAAAAAAAEEEAAEEAAEEEAEGGGVWRHPSRGDDIEAGKPGGDEGCAAGGGGAAGSGAPHHGADIGPPPPLPAVSRALRLVRTLSYFTVASLSGAGSAAAAAAAVASSAATPPPSPPHPQAAHDRLPPPFSGPEERLLLLCLLLHAADVSNPCRPPRAAAAWAERVRAEAAAQATLERARGLPVSPAGVARDEPGQLAATIAFSEFVVAPLLVVLTRARPGFHFFLARLVANRLALGEAHREALASAVATGARTQQDADGEGARLRARQAAFLAAVDVSAQLGALGVGSAGGGSPSRHHSPPRSHSGLLRPPQPPQPQQGAGHHLHGPGRAGGSGSHGSSPASHHRSAHGAPPPLRNIFFSFRRASSSAPTGGGSLSRSRSSAFLGSDAPTPGAYADDASIFAPSPPPWVAPVSHSLHDAHGGGGASKPHGSPPPPSLHFHHPPQAGHTLRHAVSLDSVEAASIAAAGGMTGWGGWAGGGGGGGGGGGTSRRAARELLFGAAAAGGGGAMGGEGALFEASTIYEASATLESGLSPASLIAQGPGSRGAGSGVEALAAARRAGGQA